MKRTRRISFKNWCKKDLDDERTINYTVHYRDGLIYKFTSNDYSPISIWWLSEHAMVDNVELINGEWHVELSGRR